MDNNIKRAVDVLRGGGVEVLCGEAARFSRSLDHTRFSAMPAAVVMAASEADIEKTLSAANEFGVGVSVRGSGTGCAGGCVPIDGGLVLDVSRINFIEIDAFSRVARVGAGAITADIDAAARKFGLMYAPDPSSHKFCSIGGNIACNAGGLRALKYGTTRDNVLALVAFTGEGKRVQCALPIKKYSVGLNLRDFFIGSEGTLGVVSQAWVRLVPAPEATATVVAFFDGDFAAFEGVGRIMKSPLEPSVLEFMDADTSGCVRRKAPELGIPAGKALLLVEFDGTAAEVFENARKCAGMFEQALVAEDPERRERLWKMRRYASSSMYEFGDSKINQDIVLPYASLREFFAFYKDLGARFNLPNPVFGHSGDGNYHIHFMYNAADDGAKLRAKEAMRLSIEKAVSLGGAVSGEHGIGFLKSKYMPIQHSEYELQLMREIKRVFDPNGILNRGKVMFPSDAGERLEPLKGIKLPWD